MAWCYLCPYLTDFHTYRGEYFIYRRAVVGVPSDESGPEIKELLGFFLAGGVLFEAKLSALVT